MKCVRESPDHALRERSPERYTLCMHTYMRAYVRKYGMSSSFLMKCSEKEINVIITNSISDQFVTIIACMVIGALCFNQLY